MPDTFNMSDVFISYSRKNSDFVHKLYDAFKAIDKEVWVDFEDIPLTADWWKEIEAGIDAAETFIFVVTPDSVRSEICRDEVDHAVKANKRIVPILHKEIVEDDDKAKIHEKISAHNWIFVRDEDDFDAAFQMLMQSVETDLDHNRTHTRLLVRAKEWMDNNKGRSYLLRDEDLRQAEAWFAQGVNKSPSPTTLHAQYISASRMAQSQRQRVALFGVTIALGIAIALTIFSIFQWRDAQLERQRADAARDDAEKSAIRARSLTLSAYSQDALSEENPDLALALALEAVKVDDQHPQVLKSLREAAYAPGTRFRMTEHTGFVNDVDIDKRGGLVLSGSADTTACIWDLRDGKQLKCLGNNGDPAHNSEVIAVEYFEDGNRAATVDNNGLIKLWDTDPRSDTFGNETQQHKFDEPIFSFSIMPDDESILVGMGSGVINRWMLDDDQITPFVETHDGQINALAVAKDGSIALSAGEDNLVGVWDIQTGELISLLEGHTDHVLSVAINDKGTEALSGGQDDSFIRWNLEDYSMVYVIQGHDSGVSDVAFGPKPTQITTASWDNSIRIWNMFTRKIVTEYEGHTGGINRIAIDDQARFIVSGSFDTDIRVWETSSFIEVAFIEGDGSNMQYLTYSPDGEFVATAHDSGNIMLWNTRGYRYLKTLNGFEGRAISVGVSQDSEKVAAISSDNDLMVWDWESDEELIALEDIADRLYMVFFATSNDHVYVALSESLVWYDIATGEQLGEIFYEGTIGGNNALSVSKDGKLLLAGLSGSDDNLHLISLETGEIIEDFEGHTDGILSTAFSADGTIGVSGSWDNSVRIWDLETGRRTHTLVAHTERVSSVAITADGRYVTSGSNDRSMHLWDLTVSTDELEYNGHTDRIQIVAFHPNGREMISGSIDTTATVWRFPHPLDELLGWIQRNRYVPELNCTERNVYEIEPYCTDDD